MDSKVMKEYIKKQLSKELESVREIWESEELGKGRFRGKLGLGIREFPAFVPQTIRVHLWDM